MNQIPLIRVVVGILERHDRQLFIAKRPAHVVMPGYWEFPGGKIEAEESQYQALIREFQEEVGIWVEEACYLKTFMHPFPDRCVELHVWHITGYSGDACGNEGQEFQWVSHQALSQFTFMPSNVDLLAFLHQRYHSS